MLQEVQVGSDRLLTGASAPVLIGGPALNAAVGAALGRRGVDPVRLGEPGEALAVHTSAGWVLHLDPGAGTTGLAGQLASRPEAPVALLAGPWDGAVVRPWELALTRTLPLIRLLPALAGRRVVALVSGRPDDRLAVDDAELLGRCDRAPEADEEPCPPHLGAAWARQLIAVPESRDIGDDAKTTRQVDGETNARGERNSQGRNTRQVDGDKAEALIARAHELLLRRAVPAELLTLLRVDELIGDPDGPRPAGLIEHLVRRARAGLPAPSRTGEHEFIAVHNLADTIAGLLTTSLAASTYPGLAGPDHTDPGSTGPTTTDPHDEPTPDPAVIMHARTRANVHDHGILGLGLSRWSEPHVGALLHAGVGPVRPPVPVVIPPHPEFPDRVAHRMSAALHSGMLKHGGPWTTRLAAALTELLDLPADRSLLLTASGSAALRLAVVALAGPARPGQVAVLPSYTFAATGEILAQLGYGLRFYDVDPDSWTADPNSVERALEAGDAALLITVDALGNPVDYPRLVALAARFGVPLLADSAPALGALTGGRPVGRQADAHVFSMSFAKVISAGGAGGALVLPTELMPRLTGVVDWTRSALMPEIAAIAALDQLEHLDQLHGRRAVVAAVYAEYLGGLEGVAPQQVRPGDQHAYVHWAARFQDRTLETRLAALGIGTRNYYGPVLHTLDWPGSPTAATGPLPVTELLAREVLALPMSSELTPDTAEQVAAVVRALLTTPPDRRASVHDHEVETGKIA